MTAKRKTKAQKIQAIYEALFAHFGPQNWWPADSPFEVCIGAILTQNTAWANVEKAIANLKKTNLLNPKGIANCDLELLADLIRPSGYFNQKAKRLALFCQYLIDRYDGSTDKLFAVPIMALRQELLAQHGIGPETADSMICYGGNLPVFVVDAYTKRIFARLKLISNDASYDQVQRMFMRHLPVDVALYNEYHALIVRLGAQYCKKSKPQCDLCPIGGCKVTLKGGEQ